LESVGRKEAAVQEAALATHAAELNPQIDNGNSNDTINQNVAGAESLGNEGE
jgi:hypothetical protein